MTEPDLQSLLDRCRQGDDLAWEALVRRYQGRVFGVTMHYMRDREEARDMAQETFIKLYRKLDSLRDGEAFLPWLIRLARNGCIDQLRKNKVRTPEHSVPVDEGPEIATDRPSPEESSVTHWRHGLLHQALQHLSEQSREIILLKDIQELKLGQIAEMLALPLGTVKSRSHRARIELAEAIQELDPSFGATP
jgi:RNA polymerase sigma-70 factor (ECF subfamily)